MNLPRYRDFREVRRCHAAVRVALGCLPNTTSSIAVSMHGAPVGGALAVLDDSVARTKLGKQSDVIAEAVEGILN